MPARTTKSVISKKPARKVVAKKAAKARKA
jgi:hypothetical protein